MAIKNSKQFPYYIEDWILWIGNRVDSQGNTIDFPYYRSPPLKLANYDVSFINRSGEHLAKNVGFTERQLAAAAKIVAKYRRQIVNKIEVDPAYLTETELPPHRLATRIVDRSFNITRHQTHYEVRFPYNPAMVNAMHKLAGTTPGGYNWIKHDRSWHITAIEPNLMLLKNFVEDFKNHPWDLDVETQQDFDAADTAVSDLMAHVPYLDLDFYGNLAVFNASQHLRAALDADFDFEQDPVNAAFRADNYGLRVGPKLTSHVKTHYSDIHKIILTPQAEVIQRAKNLDADIRLDNIAKFMRTIRADSWAFLSFADSNEFGSEIANIDVPGEKLFWNNKPARWANIAVNELDYLSTLNIKNTVVFTDHAVLLGRVLAELLPRHPLRILFVRKSVKGGMDY